MSQYKDFISFLANRLPSDGLTKAQIIRMADRLMHGGTWDGEKVVLDVRTPLEMAQERILTLECEQSSLMQQLGRAEGQVEMLKDRLDAVRQRCEANNWMGTAKLCSGE